MQLQYAEYADRSKAKTERVADPHVMLVLTPACYMIGYDPAKKAFRHFRMDRIGNATVQNKNLQPRKLIVDERECPFSKSFVYALISKTQQVNLTSICIKFLPQTLCRSLVHE